MGTIIEDPRNYLAIRPVPAWEAAKDAKLKARSFNHYNLGSPTRYEVFQMNYARRQKQLTSQGFMSLCWKPYQDVGKPIELNPKALVIKSLGQEDKTSEKERNAKQILSDTSHDAKNNTGNKTSNNQNGDKQDITRSNEHLQSISKNLSIVHNTKTFVKKGHSLFRVLEEENLVRKNMEYSENEMRFQTFDAGIKDGNTSTGQKIPEDDENLSCKSVQIHKRPTSSNSRPYSSRPSTASIRRPQSLDDSPSRPRSAVSFGISSEHTFDTDDDKSVKFQLWRQLCALHWLIEACHLETELAANIGQSDRMIPLAKCWNVVKPGGSRINSSTANQERYVGIKWRKFKRTPSSHQISRPPSARSRPVFSRMSSTNLSLASPPSPKFRRDSSQISSYERPISPAPSSVTMTLGGTVSDLDRAYERYTPIENEEQRVGRDDFEDYSEYHVNLRKLLETVKESVRKEIKLREQDADQIAEKRKRQRTPVYKWAYNLYLQSNKIKSKANSEVDEDDSDSVENSVPAPRSPSPARNRPSTKIRPHTAGPTPIRNRFVSNTSMVSEAEKIQLSPRLKSKRISRPKSSPPKLALRRVAFDVRFQSETREKNILNIKEQFKEVTDLKALQLHQDLTELGRSRCERMEKKFEAFKCPQNSMHRDLRDMRSAVSVDNQAEIGRGLKSSSANAARSCEWYTILLDNIIPSAFEDRTCSLALKRLEELAANSVGWQMRENSPRTKKSRSSAVMDQKVTSEAFIRVLKQLRPFELCAPDVSASIEFARKYIVKMPSKQFEELRVKLLNKD